MTLTEAPTRALPLEDPYVGLTHFTEEYADFFFGRETESSLVIGNLRAARLTLLYAESGVGKSSVLRAGVVARMHEVAARDVESHGSPRLVPVVFSSWSERPVVALAHAIGEAIRPYLGERGLPELPEDDLEAALEAASQALEATVLVILDQFEEYFLYPDEEPEPKRIAAQIARCVNRSDLRANFLISIREDSYAQLGDLFRGKVKNVYGNFLHLDFLDRAGAREAIERPIERVNELQPDAEPFSVEPALVEAVLDQVGRDEADERIETTYLQLVMRRLWEEEARAGSHVLRLATLERLGGAQAIIGSHLDRAMEGGGDGGAGLSPEQRRIAAAAFRFLVTSGGTKIALTTADLADLTGFPLAEVQPVVRHLSSSRLHILRPVVFEEGSEPRYEIFHDALAEPIREWRVRVEEEEREARAKRERAEKEEAQRAAAAAERQAQQERQRKRLALGLLALAVGALLVGATVFALVNKNLADEREADAQSVRVAERISELAQTPSFGPTAAALASVEAYRLSPTTEARERALAQLQLSPGLPTIMTGHTKGVESVAYWPGEGKLASGGDETVRLWKANGEELGVPLVAGGEVVEVAVGEENDAGTRVIVVGVDKGKTQLWRVTAEGDHGDEPFKRLPLATAKGIAFDSRAPGVLAVGGSDGRVALWSLKDLNEPLGTRQVAGRVEDLAFAADGKSLFVASSEGGYELGLAGARFSGPLPRPITKEVSAVAAAPNGSYAFGGKSGIELWDADDERGGSVRLKLPGKVYGLAFAQEGKVLVSGGSDWNVTTWDVASKRQFGSPRAANRAVINDVSIGPDDHLAAAGADFLVKVWTMGPSPALARVVGALSPHEADHSLPKIYDLVVGAGNRIATPVGLKGTAIWSLRDLSSSPAPVPHPVDRLPGQSFDAAYHGNVLATGEGKSFVIWGRGSACPDGKPGYCRLAGPDDPRSSSRVNSLVFAPYESELLLASVSRKAGRLNLWKIAATTEDREVRPLGWAHAGTELYEVSFDPGHPLVAAGAADGKLRLWDISDRRDPQPVEPEGSPDGEEQPITSLAFSPDGSLLASGGDSQQVQLWRVIDDGSGGVTVKATSGTLLQRQRITSLAFSPDGETLAAADGGGNVCFYEVESRHLIGDRSCPRGYNTSVLKGGIEAMRFVSLPGGETILLTAGRGQPIVAWDSLLWSLGDSDEVEEEVTEAVCALADRNLREDEWEAVFASTDFADDYHETCG